MQIRRKRIERQTVEVALRTDVRVEFRGGQTVVEDWKDAHDMGVESNNLAAAINDSPDRSIPLGWGRLGSCSTRRVAYGSSELRPGLQPPP